MQTIHPAELGDLYGIIPPSPPEFHWGNPAPDYTTFNVTAPSPVYSRSEPTLEVCLPTIERRTPPLGKTRLRQSLHFPAEVVKSSIFQYFYGF